MDDRPSLIVARTHIGFGSPHAIVRTRWHAAHGEPLGVEEETRLTKRMALEWPEDRAVLRAG